MSLEQDAINLDDRVFTDLGNSLGVAQNPKFNRHVDFYNLSAFRYRLIINSRVLEEGFINSQLADSRDDLDRHKGRVDGMSNYLAKDPVLDRTVGRGPVIRGRISVLLARIIPFLGFTKEHPMEIQARQQLKESEDSYAQAQDKINRDLPEAERKYSPLVVERLIEVKTAERQFLNYCDDLASTGGFDRIAGYIGSLPDKLRQARANHVAQLYSKTHTESARTGITYQQFLDSTRGGVASLSQRAAWEQFLAYKTLDQLADLGLVQKPAPPIF